MSRDSGNSLQGCHVLSLRPVGGHGGLRRAVAREGGTLLALSPWKLVARADAATHESLAAALRAQRILFTSPMSVRAAVRLLPLKRRRGQQWFAIGSTTARALHDAGIDDVVAPARMDSEGLLASPDLRNLDGTRVALVTAPAGRGRIESELQQRGAHLLRADVYERVPIRPSPRAVATLVSLHARPWLALSSAGALQQLLSTLPVPARGPLLNARVSAASERLAGIAARAGFDGIVIASSARPADLVRAMLEAS